MSERRKLSAMFSVRLSPEELAQVQARAGDSGLTVSGYLRRLAIGDPPLRPGEFRTWTSTRFLTISPSPAVSS